jgi:nucleosome binding factor SPN SPT16 subunit
VGAEWMHAKALDV